MAREILFKAKRISDGEWVEGALLDGEKYCLIGQEIKFSPYTENECKIVGYKVDRNTLCQYTGLKDDSGAKIWENDIVFVPYEDENFKVIWDSDTARFALDGDGLTIDFNDIYGYECEVIGNVFDNPGLLKEE